MEKLLISVFGWMSVLHIGFLMLGSFVMLFFSEWVLSFHARLFKIREEFIREVVLKSLSTYKLLVSVFCIVPYLVLKFFI